MADGHHNDKGAVSDESSNSAKDASVSDEVRSEKKEFASSSDEEIDSKSANRLMMTMNHEGVSPGNVNLNLDDLVYEDLEPIEDDEEAKVNSALQTAVLDATFSDEEDDDVEVQISKLFTKLQQVDSEHRTSLWDELLDILSTCSDDHIGLVINSVSSLLESELKAQDNSYVYGVLSMALDLYNGHMTIECLDEIITSFSDDFLDNDDMFSCFNTIIRKYLSEFGKELRRLTIDILLPHFGLDIVDTFRDVVEWLDSILQNENVHPRDARRAAEYLENRLVLFLAVLATFDFQGVSNVEAQILRLLEGTSAPAEDAPLFAFREKSFRLFFSIFVGSFCFRHLHSLLGKIFCLLVDSEYLQWISRNIDSLEVGLRTPCLREGSFTVIRDMILSCSFRNAKSIIDEVFETVFQQVKSQVLAAELVQEIIANNLVSLEGRINRLGWINDLAEWIPETLLPELKAEMKLVLKVLVDAETEDPRHDPFFVAKMNRLLSE